MKPNLRLYITCFAFLHVQLALCQKHFLPGYIITNNNDTTYGLIDYRGDARNSKYCVFMKDKTADPVIYEPSDIKAYRFIDSKYYISKIIPVKDEQLLVFAEFLVDGMADLYCYRDIIDDHYYIEKEKGKLLELTNEEEKIHIEGIGLYLRRSNRHIGLLKSTFSDCWEIQPEIDHAELTHKSLIKITRDYHNYVCKDEECIVYQKQLPAFRLKVAPYVGYHISQLNFKKNDLYQSLDFRTAYYPAGGIAFYISLPRLNEKISLRTNAEYGRYYFFATNMFNHSNIIYYDDVHVNCPYLLFSVSLNYTYPKGNFRPTFNAGVVAQRTILPEFKRIREVESNFMVNSYEYFDVPLAKNIFGGTGGVGFNYYLSEKIVFFLNIGCNYLFGNTPYAQTIIGSFIIQTGAYF